MYLFPSPVCAHRHQVEPWICHLGANLSGSCRGCLLPCGTRHLEVLGAPPRKVPLSNNSILWYIRGNRPGSSNFSNTHGALFLGGYVLFLRVHGTTVVLMLALALI
uniref:Uncharacterized protein n=1 Tax=Cacopsylla melanoneura TaxID=428564 RepID=A0A8D8PM40_9HEMI